MGDINSKLSRKPKPLLGNRKAKFTFYAAITGAIQRLERLSRVSYINKVELEAYLLSLSLIILLPIAEYDLWLREMTVSGLDFRNPVGVEIFNCFKKVCFIERNTKHVF